MYKNLAFGRDFLCEVCDFSGDMIDSEGTFSMSIESPPEPASRNPDQQLSQFPYHGDFSVMVHDPRYRAEKNISGESFSSTFFPFADIPLFLSGKL